MRSKMIVHPVSPYLRVLSLLGNVTRKPLPKLGFNVGICERLLLSIPSHPVILEGYRVSTADGIQVASQQISGGFIAKSQLKFVPALFRVLCRPLFVSQNLILARFKNPLAISRTS